VCGSDRRSANNRHASRTARRSLTASSSGEVLKCLWADFLVFLDLQLLLVGQLFLTSKHAFGHRDVIKVVTTSLQKIRRNSSYGNASASSSKSPPMGRFFGFFGPSAVAGWSTFFDFEARIWASRRHQSRYYKLTKNPSQLILRQRIRFQFQVPSRKQPRRQRVQLMSLRVRLEFQVLHVPRQLVNHPRQRLFL
jgi:hypothetical protein